MTNDVEYLFSSGIGHLYILCRVCGRIFPLKNVFYLLNFKTFLCILQMNPCHRYMLQIFSPLLLLNFLNNVFWRTEGFNFPEVQFIFFPSMVIAFCGLFTKFVPTHGIKEFLQGFLLEILWL